MPHNKACQPEAIAGDTILVCCYIVMSQQLIRAPINGIYVLQVFYWGTTYRWYTPIAVAMMTRRAIAILNITIRTKIRLMSSGLKQILLACTKSINGSSRVKRTGSAIEIQHYIAIVWGHINNHYKVTSCQWTPHSSFVSMRCGLLFLCSMYDLYSYLVTVAFHVTSRYNKSCYDDISLCIYFN